MNDFKVVRIIDGDTFDVSPSWNWGNQTGNRIRPAGYDAPELGTHAGKSAEQRLRELILGREVQLGDAYRVDRGRLVCEVYVQGKNLKDIARSIIF